MIRRIACLLAVLCTAPLPLAFGWGNEGHMAINRAAAAKLPADMPAFLRRASARLAYVGPEPDRWRNRSEYSVKNAQEPDHFMDMERLDGFGELPEGRYEFYRRLYEMRAKAGANSDNLLPEKVGLQPYATIEVYDRLKVAFREYRRMKAEHKRTTAVEQNIVFYAGWLGHYVADGANPLHTTVNYNGWVEANPKGFTTSRQTHSNFENAFVNQHLSELKFAGLVQRPTRVEHPFRDYVVYLRKSQHEVEPLYALEKAGAFKERGTPAGVEFLREQFARGTQMLVDLWYTAWVDSAEPVAARQ